MNRHTTETHPRPWLALAVLCMSLFVIVADTTIVNEPLAPTGIVRMKLPIEAVCHDEYRLSSAT